MFVCLECKVTLCWKRDPHLTSYSSVCTSYCTLNDDLYHLWLFFIFFILRNLFFFNFHFLKNMSWNTTWNSICFFFLFPFLSPLLLLTLAVLSAQYRYRYPWFSPLYILCTASYLWRHSPALGILCIGKDFHVLWPNNPERRWTQASALLLSVVHFCFLDFCSHL